MTAAIIAAAEGKPDTERSPQTRQTPVAGEPAARGCRHARLSGSMGLRHIAPVCLNQPARGRPGDVKTTTVEYVDVLCTFNGPRKPFRELGQITFRVRREVAVSAAFTCCASCFGPVWRAA